MTVIDANSIGASLSCGKPGCPCGKPQHDGQWLTHCPSHDDEHPSLSLSDSDTGKVLIKCHAGCTQEAVISALKAKGLWDGIYYPETSETVKHPPKSPKSRYKNGGKTVPLSNGTPETGLTLAALAEAKKLPVDFLKSLGLSDFKYKGQPSIRIPYYDKGGNEIAIRFRLSLGFNGENRFVWRKGNHPMLYGLWRLSEIQRAGWVLLVEGESDCWTCWHEGITALGIPGKNNWKLEWRAYLQDIKEVYLWQEPCAEDLTGRVYKSTPGLKVIIADSHAKDISEAHIKGVDIKRYLEKRKNEARLAADIEKEARIAGLNDLRQKASPVLNSQVDIIMLLRRAIRRTYGGDIKSPLITYLAANSRLLKLKTGGMLAHLLLTGPSGIGKSYCWIVIRNLLPQDSYIEIHAGSPRALIYGDDDLEHKVLIFSEADSMPKGENNSPASAIRNLLQDGRLSYEVTIRDEQTGLFKAHKIEREGPTVLITTSIKPLGEQLGTRLFTLELASDKDQVRAALNMQAARELEDIPANPDDALIAFQSYLQALTPWEVVIPYAPILAEKISTLIMAPRIQRDFERLLSFIKSVTILRHNHRQKDNAGRLIATLDDYATVRALVAEMYEDTVSGTSVRLKQIVEKVNELASNQDSQTKGITASSIAKALDLSKPTASRAINKAVKSGWLVNTESRKGYPSKLIPGEPLPERTGLPTLEDLTPVPTVSSDSVTVPQIQDQIGEQVGVSLFHENREDISPILTDIEPKEVAKWKL